MSDISAVKKSGRNEQSFRHEKLATEFHKILQKILSMEIILPDNTMVSVTRVRVNPGLTFIDAEISCLGASTLEQVLAFLNENLWTIKGLCSQELPRLKYMPELRFHADTATDYLLKKRINVTNV